ncbi:MAG: glycosyltransferase family 1 protein [Oscillospiraceae bacterium]|jgi:glycosyltransferase involved in cell wall biosynthesis
MIRVLHVLSSLEAGGGVQQMLYNYYGHMDRDSIRFDFIVHGEKTGKLEKAFEVWGCRIFHVTAKKKSLRRNLKDLEQVVKSGNYDIMHCHQGLKGFFALRIAKKHGIAIRLSHSHQGPQSENVALSLINIIFRLLLKHYATHWLACSEHAGKWAYGKNAMKSEKFRLFHNAVELEKFSFSESVRKEVREELGLADKLVIGSIARFVHLKNHKFLITVFNEVYRREKDAVLLLIGGGELESELRRQVEDLGLTRAVRFLGLRDDVPRLMQAFDLFITTSHSEGLSMVLAEAQAAGLSSLAADSITKELNVTGLITYISLDEEADVWAREALRLARHGCRTDTAEIIRTAGYDIKREAPALGGFYCGLLNDGME